MSVQQESSEEFLMESVKHEPVENSEHEEGMQSCTQRMPNFETVIINENQSMAEDEATAGVRGCKIEGGDNTEEDIKSSPLLVPQFETVFIKEEPDLAEGLVTDRQCVEFLQLRHIIPREKLCKRGHKMKLVYGRKIRWRCYSSDCRADLGLRAGTWLHPSTLPLRNIILFIYCWAHEITSIEFCRRELSMSPHTTVDWSMFLREVCALTISRDTGVIGGPGHTVEIDEAYFSKRKYNARRKLPQKCIFGGIDRETGKCFIVFVRDRSAQTLLPIINERIAPGTTIISDRWKSFSELAKNYDHLSGHFVDPTTGGGHTQNIDRLWRSAEERNKRRCGIHKQMLESYLSEFLWRRSIASSDPFVKILEAISEETKNYKDSAVFLRLRKI